MRFKDLQARIGRFRKDESGSHTVEAVIWIPMFVIVLALVMNVTIVFFQESQMLRVVQDGNRLLSVGRLLSTEETEQYIRERLTYLSDNIDVATAIDSGTVTTRLAIAATDMMPMPLLKDKFADLQIVVSAQQYVEY